MQYSLKAKSKNYFPDESFDLSGNRNFYSIGRHRRNDIRVEHSSVSSHHADLKLVNGQEWELVDRGSSNGTFVNGEKVERRVLGVGDVIRLASFDFEVLASPNESGEDKEILLAVAHKELADLKSELRKSNDQLSRFQNEIDKHESDATSFDSDLKKAQQSVARLEGELEVQKEQVAAKNLSIQSLGAEVKDLKKQIKDEKASSLKAATAAEGREKKLEKELAELKEKFSKKQSDLEEEVIRKTELKSELCRTEGKVNQLENELEIRHRDLAERDSSIRSLDAQVAELSRQLEEWQRAHAEMETAAAERDEALRLSHAETATAEEKLTRWIARLDEFAANLLRDWSEWGVEDLRDGDFAGEHAAIDRAETIRVKIREELDRIEPIWNEFGEGVQDELRNRKEQLEEEVQSLSGEIDEKSHDEEVLGKELSDLRQRVDDEIRRAQGLSRKGIEVEIPERFESMVIVRDEEQRIFIDLIDRLEFFDKLLEGYRRSRKLRDVVEELEEFRHRFHHILAAHGVEPFQVPEGTVLSPKHRREVRILAKKGWGVKEHGEKTFRPGEVTKVVRHGYRSGEGSEAVILRKVEVLIREPEG